MAQTAPARPALILLALWALNFATSAQFLVVTPILPIIRDQLHVAQELLGLLITTYAVGVGVFSLIGGPVSDRWGRRIVLLVGAFGMAGALLLHQFAGDFASLLLVRLLAGCASGTLAGASIAYVADAFPYAQRGRANGILASGFAAGQILGIPLGTLLGEQSYTLPFVVFGVFVGIAALLILFFVPQPDVEMSDRLSVPAALRAYASLLSRGPTLAAAVAYILMFFGVSLFITFLPTYLTDFFHVTPTMVSTLFVVGGVANLIVAPISGALSDRVGRKVLIVTGSTLMGLLMAAIPWLLTEFWIAYILFFTIMVFVALRISPLQALVSSLVSSRERGSLLAVTFAVGQVGFGLGGSLAGPLFDSYGFAANCIVGGAMAVLTAAVVLLMIPEPQGDLDAVDDAEAARRALAEATAATTD